MNASIRVAAALVGLSLACFPDAEVLAQISKQDFVKQTELFKGYMEVFPAFTTSRCATPAIVSTMAFVTGLRIPGSPLRIGDQIVAINGKPLTASSEGALPNALSTIAPNDRIVMTVVRQGERMDLPIGCDDSLPLYKARWDAYRAIVDRDFDGCVERIPALVSVWGGMSAHTRWLQMHCMLYAKRLKRSDWLPALFEYYQLLIEEARWDPADFMAARREILGSKEFFRRRHEQPLFEELELLLEANQWPKALTQHPAISQ